MSHCWVRVMFRQLSTDSPQGTSSKAFFASVFITYSWPLSFPTAASDRGAQGELWGVERTRDLAAASWLRMGSVRRVCQLYCTLLHVGFCITFI